MGTQAEKMIADGYMPAPEVARLVGRDISSVYRWITNKHIEAERVGRAWYIKRTSLVTYLGEPAARRFGIVLDSEA